MSYIFLYHCNMYIFPCRYIYCILQDFLPYS